MLSSSSRAGFSGPRINCCRLKKSNRFNDVPLTPKYNDPCSLNLTSTEPVDCPTVSGVRFSSTAGKGATHGTQQHEEGMIYEEDTPQLSESEDVCCRRSEMTDEDVPESLETDEATKEDDCYNRRPVNEKHYLLSRYLFPHWVIYVAW
uniref:Uncharacterized protein n=1 Tax=Timema bartmani TaxID=61472 RepID=A0A7R9FDT9_9NEOP|nr:unnamed protein product [Timema bartmani]